MKRILLGVALVLAGCTDLNFKRNLMGEVKAVVQQEQRDTGIVTSLLVTPSYADQAVRNGFCGPSGCLVECVNDKCKTVSEQTCHWFRCAIDLSLTEKPRVVCFHEKEIVCAGQ